MTVDLRQMEMDLMGRCAKGDERAWEELYVAHAPIVARFLTRMMGPGSHVDDLVQVVFVELFSSVKRFRGDAKLTTWLYGIAKNVAHKHIRTETRHRRRKEAWKDHLQVMSNGIIDGRRQAEARMLVSALDDAVQTLDPKHRAVWVMRELEGLSTEEVAEALNIRAGTVRSRLFKARNTVMKRLEEKRTASGMHRAISDEEAEMIYRSDVAVKRVDA